MPLYQVLKPFNAIRFDTVYQTPLQQYVLLNDLLDFNPNGPGNTASLYRNQQYLGEIDTNAQQTQYWLSNGITMLAPSTDAVGSLSIVTALPSSGAENQQVLLTTGTLPGIYAWDGSIGQWRNGSWPSSQTVSFVIGLGTTSMNFGWRVPAYYGEAGFNFTNAIPIIVLDPGDGSIPALFPVLGGSNDEGPTFLYTYQNLGTYTVSLTGQSVGYLDVSEQGLISLDVSGLTGLTGLLCYSNSFSSLDFSGLTALQNLDCDTCTSAVSLDFSGLTALQNLDCGSCTSVSSLDFSGLTALQSLYCSSCTSVSSLDFSGLTALQSLYCYECTSAVSLDFSGLTALQTLDCDTCTSAVSLDFSGLTALQSLDCGICTSVSSLDFSGLTALQTLYCYDCTSAVSLDFSGLTALQNLYCSGCTSVSSLDFSGLTALQNLYCDTCTSVSSLDFSGLTALQFLDCDTCTSAVSLDFSGLTALQTLYCNDCTVLTTTDVTGCTPLTYLNYSDQGGGGCALSLDSVNGLLAALVANGQSGGYLDISGGTNATPTDTDDYDTLIANGWSVTTN